jgi:hypothetical protein
MPQEQTTLIQLSMARQALAKASTMEDVLKIRDKAAAIKVYLAAIQESLEIQNEAAEIKLRSERKAGVFLSGMTKRGGARDGKRADIMSARLDELGINHKQSSRWQAEASVPEEVFNEWVQHVSAGGAELTQAGLLKLAKNTHVSNNSCNNEWYTPERFIESARIVMGGIDCDSASCAAANEIVKADTHFTVDDDGLSREWHGRVWLNPPYEKQAILSFCDKLVQELKAERVSQACVLVNNATETAWLQRLLGSAAAVCFPASRIKFLDSSLEQKQSPLQGQAALYFGDGSDAFTMEWQQYGCVMHPVAGRA